MAEKAGKQEKLTPAMRQFHHFKSQYPEAILFFRMGDFYETFYEDATVCSRVLGIALTSRGKGSDGEAIPLAGVPYHSVDNYLRKMIQAGHKVAVCEQMEDASQAKGVVKRDVVRLVTPGTLTEETMLEERRGNYLAAIELGDLARDAAGGKGRGIDRGRDHGHDRDGSGAGRMATDTRRATVGLAWVELSTGEFVAQQLPWPRVLDELARVQPAECLLPDEGDSLQQGLEKQIGEVISAVVTHRPGWSFERSRGRRLLKEQFQIASLEGFGITRADSRVGAAGAILDYLQETQKTALSHITGLRTPSPESFLQLDWTTLRSLEIERTLRDNRSEGSLLYCLDETVTAMGGRLLRQSVCYPLRKLAAIEKRQDAVAELVQLDEVRQRLREQLKQMADVERITTRVSTGRVSPRDLLSLGRALAALPGVRTAMEGVRAQAALELLEQCAFPSSLAELIEQAISPEAGLVLREGGVIRDGYDQEVDRLREMMRGGRDWLAEYQKRLVEQTGLASLKVGYNKVFGYYVELSNAFRGEVPEGFVRKQTLKNAERYVTEELKEYESEVLTAEQRCRERELELFEAVRARVAEQTLLLQQIAQGLAGLDMLASLAHVARYRNYCRPEMTTEPVLCVEDGRHPVLDVILGSGFVPNSVALGDSDGELMIITGPNMSGKSTYIRQTALLLIMAQVGSFIPAASARIGVADRVFTRVGASDELSRGQSTFMVEMIETATILNNATDRSLVILDEIGRGTSTYDGLSLAWAITEFMATSIHARTLFATHYHELTELGDLLTQVSNRNVAVREWKDEVVFLHKIVPGRTDKSYGIHVARLAGIPRPVLSRSREILGELESHFAKEAHVPQLGGRLEQARDQGLLFDMTASPDPVLERLRSIDINGLTPIEAINLLSEIKDELESRS